MEEDEGNEERTLYNIYIYTTHTHTHTHTHTQE